MSIVQSDHEEKLIKTATFDITALLEVADAKHSLIGVRWCLILFHS